MRFDLNTFDDFPLKSHIARGVTKRASLSEAQNHRCAYCGIRLTDTKLAHDEATIDHVVPRVAGGRPIWSNEVMACRLCNEGRGAMYADHYFQIVTWKGREKAARYAHRRRKRRGKGVFSGREKVTAPQLAVNG